MKNELTLFDAMVEKLAVDGAEPTPLEEVSAMGLVLPFEEGRPVTERLGRIRGMVKHLRTRPLPAGTYRSKAELELLQVLGRLLEMGEELAEDEPQVIEELGALALQRQLFEDLLYAATEDFFALVEELDEPYGV
ncbi:MAG: hypothetical protein ACYDCL_04955 [Myxococcales bacterium]